MFVAASLECFPDLSPQEALEKLRDLEYTAVEFPIHESLKLQFRAEMFNVLNHPNFGPPNGAFISPPNGGPAGFGLSNQMLGRSFAGNNLGGGAFDPLYQLGGPRSIQFALKLVF